MVTRISSILFAITLLFFMTASTASAAQANEDVAQSRHNLSVGGGNLATWNNTVGGTGTTEICVFCHTPHQANTSNTGMSMMEVMEAAPLWNKRLNDPLNYTTHAGDMGGVAAATASNINFALIGQGSLACLSCHDGSQAIDVMVNAPGSGGWVAAGADLGYTFPTYGTGAGFDTFGVGTGNNAAYIGVQLMNDHPVSVVFGGDCTNGQATCLGSTNEGFRGATYETFGEGAWFVQDSVGVTTQIKIYEKDAQDFNSAALATDTVGSVECGSCHNPHLPTNTAGGPDSLFLRLGSNDASQICLTCHVK